MASLIPGFWVARGCPFPLGAVRQRYPTVFETIGDTGLEWCR
jgi:hypothetical protein